MNDTDTLIKESNLNNDSLKLSLHKYIFEDDVEKLSNSLKNFKDISIKDHHG